MSHEAFQELRSDEQEGSFIAFLGEVNLADTRPNSIKQRMSALLQGQTQKLASGSACDIEGMALQVQCILLQLVVKLQKAFAVVLES